jgi:TRAP-type mannitol/chloroaromatic compound transport system substrate-binding protein
MGTESHGKINHKNREMSMERRRILLASVLSIGLVAPASDVVAESADERVTDGPIVEWNLSSWGNRRAFTEAAEGLAQHVSNMTEGRFTINIAYGESLSKARENLDGISLGAFEMAMFCASYHPGKTPLLTVLDLPLLGFPNWDAQVAAFEAVYDYGPVREELARWNAVPVAAALLPNYTILGAGPEPTELSDWSGMRIRALGGMGVAMSTLGAVPTTVPAPEVYTSLERGTIDAAAFGLGTHVSFGMEEISDWYLEDFPFGTANCPIVVNATAVEALPEEYQDILLNSGRVAAHRASVDAWLVDDEQSLPVLEAAGLNAIRYTQDELDEFRKNAGEPTWQAWIDEKSAQGLPAEEVFGLITRAIEAHQ